MRRRWLDVRRPRWRGDGSPGDVSPADLVDDPTGVLAVIGLILLAVFLAAVLLPVLIFGVELVIVLVVALAGLAGRLLLGRPWTIEARSDDGRLVVRQVRGWRESADALAQLRADVERGTPGTSSPLALPGPARRGWHAAAAVILALLWLAGAGSIAALWIALAVRSAPDSGRKARAGAWLAIVLAGAGLLLDVLMVVGLIAQHQRVG